MRDTEGAGSRLDDEGTFEGLHRVTILSGGQLLVEKLEQVALRDDQSAGCDQNDHEDRSECVNYQPRKAVFESTVESGVVELAGDGVGTQNDAYPEGQDCGKSYK